MNISEVALEILVRFPLKSIARFRSVSKEWKSLIDSDFFREYYISLRSSSSVSWSIVQTKPHKLTLEIAGHYGCKTWGLTRSPGSLVRFVAETTIKSLVVLSCTDGLVSICAEASDDSRMYYIGNPLTQEWFRIPLPPFLPSQDLERLRKHSNNRFSDTGLVTKMKSGIVVSYKIVWFLTGDANKISFMIYSSDTWMWEFRNVTCVHSRYLFSHHKSIALNGILHWLSFLTTSFVTYDFYGRRANARCRIIYFPDSGNDDNVRRFRRSLTTSEGSIIVYFNEFYDNENRRLRVWRLVKYNNCPETWQLFWNVSLVSLLELGIHYFPVVMHPLNSEIIYLWSRNKRSLILFNLRTRVFRLHKEREGDSMCMDGCMLSFDRCNEYMERASGYFIPPFQGGPNHLFFSQFVLPQWLHRLPRPQPS